jgi:phage tail sheath protein FI
MPVNVTFPGVYIDELPSQVRTIVGVPTSITAFVGAAQRGPANEPIHITSWSDFERRFGGRSDQSALSYAVFQYYQNGGSEAEIVRVTGANAKPATLDLQNGVSLEAASPGVWGKGLRARVDYNTKPKANPGDPDMYNLTVRDMATGAEESFRNIEAKAGSPRALSRALEGSSLVRAAAGSNDANRPPKSADVKGDPFADPAAPGGGAAGGGAAGGGEAGGGAAGGGAAGGGDAGGGAAAAPQYVEGKDGNDGGNVGDAELKGDETKKTGIYSLLKLGNRLFNLLCIPSNDDIGFLDEAAKFCLDHRAVLLVDPPKGWTDLDKAVNGAAGTGVSGDNSKNAVLYFPRLKLLDEHGNENEYPPSGAVAGVIARTDGQRGVWKAPAGTDASIAGVQGLTVSLTNLENGELNPLGISCIRNFPVFGTVVWGARTLRGADQLADQWKYVPVRRTALFIEESLYRGTQWVVFEPNDEPLWASIRLNVGAFMNSLWRQGAFQGKTPQDAYLVKCDSENNPQNDIDRGIVNILVGFAPLKPAEFVLIHIQQLAGQIQT